MDSLSSFSAEKFVCWRHLLGLCTLLIVATWTTNVASAESAESETDAKLNKPINSIFLEKAILEAPEQTKFDSTIWKNAVQKRRFMLTDLYKQHLNETNHKFTQNLLGKPSFTERGYECYDLGLYNDRKIFLAIYFFK